MRISDWSSDVCSSDLSGRFHVRYPVLPGVFQGVRPSHDMARGSGSDKTAGSSRGAMSQALVWIGANPLGRTGAMCMMRRQSPPRGSACNSVRLLRSTTSDRKSVVEGKSGSVRVDLVGGRIFKKKKNKTRK